MKPGIVACVKRQEAGALTGDVGQSVLGSPQSWRVGCYVFAPLLGSESIRILLKRAVGWLVGGFGWRYRGKSGNVSWL